MSVEFGLKIYFFSYEKTFQTPTTKIRKMKVCETSFMLL